MQVKSYSDIFKTDSANRPECRTLNLDPTFTDSNKAHSQFPRAKTRTVDKVRPTNVNRVVHTHRRIKAKKLAGCKDNSKLTTLISAKFHRK